MTTKALCGIVAAVLGIVFACAVGSAVVVGGVAAACTVTAPVGADPVATPSGARAQVDGFDSEQVGDAAIIVSVGGQLGVPVRGWIIAVATALQESGLRNLPGGDQDSIGLFQQRPSQGWGTPQQLRDPVYASTKFYQRLLTVEGWQAMPLTDAAQAVQGSAYPDAYAKQEQPATVLVAAIAGSGNWRAIPRDLEQCSATCPGSAGSGAPASPDPGCAQGAAVLARAAMWLTAWNGGPVPYLSSNDPAALLDGYRRDCSGYASMALGLPGPGLDTAGLAARSTPIQKTDLRPGDLLINIDAGAAGHVVIFDRWADTTMSSYVGYEQSGDGGTHHRVIPYPYFAGYPQPGPYRLGK
jgi:hypothetical protein